MDISVASGSYSVVRSKDNKTHVKVTGTPSFISNLEIEKNDNTLIVKYKNQNNSTNTYANNRLEIAFGQDHGEQLNATINGSGGAKIEIPFTVGRAQVNGSGDISLNELGSLECQINGSGDITCKKSGPVEVSICGSGDVSVGSVSESLKAKIVGSGDVTLGLGTVDCFIVDVSGSGDIDARKITTRCAKLRITGSGDIVIGRVLEESIEKHSKNGCIKVLQRG